MSLNDPTPSTYGSNLVPETTINGHDLIAEGDRTLTIPCQDGAYGLYIGAHSDDSNGFSVSITWTTAAGNITSERTATELGASSVTDVAFEENVYGAVAEVTFTDTSGAASNNINAHIQIDR